jgi:hypothetical protein
VRPALRSSFASALMQQMHRWCLLAYRRWPWCHGPSAIRDHKLLLADQPGVEHLFTGFAPIWSHRAFTWSGGIASIFLMALQ